MWVGRKNRLEAQSGKAGGGDAELRLGSLRWCIGVGWLAANIVVVVAVDANARATGASADRLPNPIPATSSVLDRCGIFCKWYK